MTVTQMTPEEVRLLDGMADQMAIAVGNARLFDDSQRRLTELAVVNEISRTLISGGFDLMAMRVYETLPLPTSVRCWLMMRRFSSITLTAMVRCDVASGMLKLAAMFSAIFL